MAFSSLFMTWLLCVVFWKPVLGLINDKIGLAAMLLTSASATALAGVYLPSMVYGTPVILMYVAAVDVIWNLERVGGTATRHRPGDGRARVQRSSPCHCFYAGNAVGAPIWGLLGTSGNTKLVLYLAPVLLALFVLTSLVAAKLGNAQYRLLAQAETPPPVAKSQAPRHNADTGSACGRSASASSSMTIGTLTGRWSER